MKKQTWKRAVLLFAAMLLLTTASTRLQAATGLCGGGLVFLPFTDLPASNPFFCSIAYAYFSGLTVGTSPTTFSPSAVVTREQMAAFIARTHDSALKKGSPRAALDQWWTPVLPTSLGLTDTGTWPVSVRSDGEDLWTANYIGDTVSQVHASTGKLIGTWTGADNAQGVVIARGLIYVVGSTNPGRLYVINPAQPAGPVTVAQNGGSALALGGDPAAITFDGFRLWTANTTGSVSIVSFDGTSYSATTITSGFSTPVGILYDGSNVWVVDAGDQTIKKLNSASGVSAGGVIQSVPVGQEPYWPAFDGANIWVPNRGMNTITVVRASTGEVIETLSGNGLSRPMVAAFDGQRVLVTNINGHSVSLWKAADLTPLGSFSTGAGTSPHGACSDGINFWVTLLDVTKLARF
jgi:S-layer family protein